MADEAPTLETFENPILHVLIVGFHHQKGSTIEYCHPRLGIPSSEQSLTSSLPSPWKPLLHIALPDGCHNYDEGHVTFSLPSLISEGSVYGVSCYRQIQSRDLPSPTSDVTRSTVQKAVCVLCTWPAYPAIIAKLKLVTHAYFNGKNFDDVHILHQAFDDLNASLTRSHALEVCCHGDSLLCIVNKCQHRLLQVVKAVLLQCRVLVYGDNPGTVSDAVVAIATLFPFSMEALICQPTANEEGLPLCVFPSHASLQPYLSLQQMNMLSNSCCVLGGVVNPLYYHQWKAVADLLVKH